LRKFVWAPNWRKFALALSLTFPQHPLPHKTYLSTMSTVRTKHSYETQFSIFRNNIYVVCPMCKAQAIIKTPALPNRHTAEKEIRLVCTACGHSKRQDEKAGPVSYLPNYKIIKSRYPAAGVRVDPYFFLPLWLSIPCCDEDLWAYNYEHLDFLKAHIESKLRERNLTTILNNSIGSRLPRWMTAKKNRQAVLKCIAQLKEKSFR
jgi:hypothetical protein